MYNYILNCCTSDLEGRQDESVPPDLWLVMQLTHPALEAASTAPTGSASFTNEERREETRKGKATQVGTNLTFRANIEQRATVIQSLEVQRPCLHLNKRVIFFSATFSGTDFRI